MSAKVYAGPLIGWIDPTLRALGDRCMEIAATLAPHAQDEHPLFSMGMFGNRKPAPAANHDPGDED